MNAMTAQDMSISADACCVKLSKADSTQGITVRLGYRPPYDVAAMLAFMETRRIKAIESIAAGPDKYEARRTFGINAVLHEDFPAGDGLRVPGALDGRDMDEDVLSAIRRCDETITLSGVEPLHGSIGHSKFLVE